MSTAPKREFKNLNIKDRMQIVEAHASEQGIGTLVKTGTVHKLAGAATANEEPAAPVPVVDQPPAETTPPKVEKGTTKKERKAIATSSRTDQTRRMGVDLPLYLIKEIRQTAADGPTIRYIITRALKKDGFTVLPEDLIEDGRRES